MVNVKGVLTVKHRDGVNGRFSVGDLATTLGDFKVKESILDQFEEGRYEGEFVIQSIYLGRPYISRGSLITDIRAKVVEINLDVVEEGEIEQPTSAEPDPIEEAKVEEAIASKVTFVNDSDDSNSDNVKIAPQPDVKSENSNEFKLSDDVAKDYEVLINEVGSELVYQIANKQPVKLDPTVDRALFYKQRDALKAHGYRFNAMTQSWSKEGE